MKLSATLALLGWLIILSPQTVHGKAWKGIVPLHSTHADVDRLLGHPTLEDSGYEVDGERVQITYSAQGCEEGLPSGWNVPPNTVVNISVSLSEDLKLADVLVAGKNYEQIYGADTLHIDYVDAEDGVRYSTEHGTVQRTSYFATEADNEKFRCGEDKYAAPVPAGAKNKFEQHPYDSYGKIPFQDAEARLDTFIIELSDLNEAKPRYRGFIIVYAGRSSLASEAKAIAECSKNYLVNVREADPESLIAVDGGYRDQFIVELYIMPNDAYPPLLMPTVSPKKVQILDGRLAPCSGAGSK